MVSNLTNISETLVNITKCQPVICKCPASPLYVNIMFLMFLIAVIVFIWTRYTMKPLHAGGFSFLFVFILCIIGGQLGWIPSWLSFSILGGIVVVSLYLWRIQLLE